MSVVKDAIENSINSKTADLLDMSKDELEEAIKAEAEKSANKLVDEIAKEDSDPDPLFWLKKINKYLEGVPKGIIEYFKNLEELAEQLTQNEVDVICEYTAWRVNILVEKMRQSVVRTLRRQFKQAKKIIEPIKILLDFLKNPLSVLEAVVKVIKYLLELFCKPYYELIKFIVQLAVEVSKLAKNLQSIMEVLPPSPPSPKINYNKFVLNIGTITMDMLTADTDNMQNPEEMFPEPEKKPFDKNTFKKVFNTKKKKESMISYSPEVTDNGGSEIT